MMVFVTSHSIALEDPKMSGGVTSAVGQPCTCGAVRAGRWSGRATGTVWIGDAPWDATVLGANPVDRSIKRGLQLKQQPIPTASPSVQVVHADAHEPCMQAVDIRSPRREFSTTFATWGVAVFEAGCSKVAPYQRLRLAGPCAVHDAEASGAEKWRAVQAYVVS